MRGKKMTNRPDGQELCYLEASRVESPAGDLSGVTLQTQAHETLGTLDGVLINPTERRLRYFVVETPGWFRSRRRLISADHLVCVESDRNTLRVDVNPADVAALDEFDFKSVREFSSDDAIAAMFSRCRVA
jgi:hypothetical protein